VITEFWPAGRVGVEKPPGARHWSRQAPEKGEMVPARLQVIDQSLVSRVLCLSLGIKQEATATWYGMISARWFKS